MTTDALSQLSQELDHYDGRWVAMRRGVIVAHAEDEESLRVHPDIQEGDQLFPVGPPATGFYMIGV